MPLQKSKGRGKKAMQAAVSAEWAIIEDQPSYRVRRDGQVVSLKYGKFYILAKSPRKDGYLQVYLRQNGIQSNTLIHRLVAKAFIPNPENKPYVNHKDGNKKNNNVDNLEWNTVSENAKHAFAIGLKKVSDYQRSVCAKLSKINSIPVYQYTKALKLVKKYKSYNDAMRKLGIDSSAICKCVKGKNSHAGGFIWKQQPI